MGWCCAEELNALPNREAGLRLLLLADAGVGDRKLFALPLPRVEKTGRELSKKRMARLKNWKTMLWEQSRMTNLQDKWEDPAELPDKKGKE
jgi:hypothetical protein